MPVTLLDIAKANKASEGVAGLISETSKAVPEITMVPARTIKGISYESLVRITNPTVAFRNANEGSDASKGVYENREYKTYNLPAEWVCDKAVADRSQDGAAAYIAMEAQGIMEAAMQWLGSQFYYGTGNDAKGFPGLLAALDTGNMVLDAGGTTADTGSSVWGVKFGPQDVQWLWGEEGALNLSDVTIERVLDSNNKPYWAYCQHMLAYPGLKVSSIRSIGRIKKLTEDSGKGLTDAKISTFLSKFQVGKLPDVLFMNRRSLAQLQASRTATNATGTPAPFPTEAFNIPIAVTDSILSTEALTL